ncbi:MAG: pyridoxal-phosphate dependent enzyme [Acidobacteria bacterium]|nr:pyridoxal-phosphate dependent enzyme [Acidobacteriota bacterium]
MTSCSRCGHPAPLLADDPACSCGGTPRIPELADPGRHEEWIEGPLDLWRYRRAFPFLGPSRAVTLGEGLVPLQPLEIAELERPVLVLRDDLEPTGSWKDRGSALLVAALAASGRRQLVEDSSGNAALSLARYAAIGGMQLTCYVPASTSPLKKSLVREAGAELVEVEGPRQAATDALRAALGEGVTYASHALQPLHAAGAASAAFNICEMLGRMPGAVVAAAGHGGYVAGVAAGFRALARAGRGRMPRIIAVQAAGCAPLARAFAEAANDAAPWGESRGSLAEGVQVTRPARAREVLRAVRESGGLVGTADELALDRAVRLLWREGLRVEPTAALPIAWLAGFGLRRELAGVNDVVVLLSGHGIRDGRALSPGLT